MIGIVNRLHVFAPNTTFICTFVHCIFLTLHGYPLNCMLRHFVSAFRFFCRKSDFPTTPHHHQHPALHQISAAICTIVKTLQLQCHHFIVALLSNIPFTKVLHVHFYNEQHPRPCCSLRHLPFVG